MALLRRRRGGPRGPPLWAPASAGCRPPPCRAWAPGRNARPSGPKPSVVCGPAPACRLRRRSASAFCAAPPPPRPLPGAVLRLRRGARAARSRAPGPGPPRGLPLAPALSGGGLRPCAVVRAVAPGCVPGLRCLRPGRGLPPAPVGALRSAPGGLRGLRFALPPFFRPAPPALCARVCGVVVPVWVPHPCPWACAPFSALLGLACALARLRSRRRAPLLRPGALHILCGWGSPRAPPVPAAPLGLRGSARLVPRAPPPLRGPRFSRPSCGPPAALRAAPQRLPARLTNRKL